MKEFIMTWKHWIIGAALTVAPAFAEPTFKVPFDFEIGGTQWSAGTYQVEVLKTGFTRIRNLDTHQSQFVLANPADSVVKDAGLGAMTFHRYGDRYFLYQISFGTDVGRQMPASPKERELASRTDRTLALIRTSQK
jgi:hypothetical protein